MSKYYDGRRCHPLVLYQENEYRIFRDKHGKIHVERKRTVEVVDSFTGETFVWWHGLTQLDSYWTTYLYADSRARKLAVNRKYAKRGEVWITRRKMLLAGKLWTARCDDWDGQSTPCPLQRDGADGTPSCPIRFFFMGYSGGRLRKLPGVCDGPLNDVSTNVCVPIRRDKHGFSMAHLHKVRREIWARDNKRKDTERKAAERRQDDKTCRSYDSIVLRSPGTQPLQSM